MGGEGNLLMLRQALRDEVAERGYPVPPKDPQWYPGVQEFVDLYSSAGFIDVEAQLIPRATPLPAGVSAWVTTFRAGWLDLAQVPEHERAAIADAVQRRLTNILQTPDGGWSADYVRLRFTMRKPH